jgi:hypothetical protein
LKRFTADYAQAIRKMKIKHKVNYQKTEKILIELGFISKRNRTEETEEKVLFVDLWGCLQGDVNKGINKVNLKTLLGAVQGLKIDITSCKDNHPSVFNDYLSPQLPGKIDEVQ